MLYVKDGMLWFILFHLGYRWKLDEELFDDGWLQVLLVNGFFIDFPTYLTFSNSFLLISTINIL